MSLFSQVVRMGSIVEVKQIAEENRKAAVLKSYPEKGAVMVIDIKSRRKKSVSFVCYCVKKINLPLNVEDINLKLHKNRC